MTNWEGQEELTLVMKYGSSSRGGRESYFLLQQTHVIEQSEEVVTKI